MVFSLFQMILYWKGFDPSQFNQLLPQGEFKLIIGDNLAQKLGLAVGDKVRLMITENSQYTPFGRVPMQRLFTVSELYYDYGEASGFEVFANLADIGRLMRIQPGEAQGYRLSWMILSKSQNCQPILKRAISVTGVSKKGSFSKRFVWKKI